jgi:hypothetical protein
MEWLVNNEIEIIGKETCVSSFEVLPSRMPGCVEDSTYSGQGSKPRLLQ